MKLTWIFLLLERVFGHDVKFSRDLGHRVRWYLGGHTAQTILDVGCGDGRHTAFFAGNGNTVHGLDIHDYRSPQSSLFHFRIYDGRTFPYTNETFDLVASFDVLEHVEEDGHLVEEAWRVLKPGGRVLFGTPNRTRLGNLLRTGGGLRPLRYPWHLGIHPVRGEILHVREYTTPDLVALFAAHRFRDIRVRPFWYGVRVGGFERFSMRRLPAVCHTYAHYLLLTASKP